MGRYIVKRLLALVAIIVCVAIIIFTIMYFIPGDPALVSLGGSSTLEEREAYRDRLGLNDPYIVQLGNYLYNTFIKFDLGESYITGASVSRGFAQRLPRTLGLGLLCLLINIVLGIPLGITCALHQNSWIDHLISILAMIGVALPGFWLALLMVQLFAQTLGWLPPMGITGEPYADWQYWVMPVLAGSIGGIANNLRMTRSAVLETIRADFVTTAKAKGLSSFKVTYKHMLPNALIPILSQLGGQFGMVISGTVIIETVFSFPGIGMYMLDGINNLDYPVVRGCVLMLAIFSAAAVLLVDLTYGLIDPRIKAQYVSYGKGGNKKHA
ncbi:MAG: ABC transporter permease [Oscillospiraceae bacterium]|nr:ABC transporter permease [Oscillospiraceae bacterium]